MAEGGVVERLEREIICSICHDHYTDPKVLPCCHYYCKQCIYRLSLRTDTGKPLLCPECRKPTILPEGGPDNLPTAFFVNRLQEIYSKIEVGALVQKPIFQVCKLHGEQLKIFCFDCSCCICRDCVIKDHHGHDFEFVSVAAPKIKEKLIQNLEPLTEIETMLSHDLNKIQHIKLDVEGQKLSLTDSIESMFKEFHEVIENRKLELLTEATAQSLLKLERLSIQEENLSMSHAVATSTINYAKRCVEHLSESEVLIMHTDIQSQIIKEVEVQRRNLNSVFENTDIGVFHADPEHLIQFCQTEARISKLADLCTISNEGLESAEVGKKSEFTIKFPARIKLPKQVIECSMKSLVGEINTKCEVNSIENNQFCIQCIPTMRGRHYLIVTANGQEIVRSPFLVSVSIHPKELVRPVRVISGMDDCHDVAVSSMGEIFVATSAGVVVYDQKGKRVRASGKLGLDARFYNVAVDSSNDVYSIIATKKSTDVVKLNPDLELISQCKIHDATKRYLSGLTLVGDEVMVCDYKRDCIKVYTKDLCFKRQIGVQGDEPRQFRFIRGISSDNHGNLYVSEEGKCCIKVFSNEGNFLRTFGYRRNKLRCPVGVCVVDQFVFVSDHYYNDYIAVFTTEGKYVTSFGQKGNNDGEFVCVWGVCADLDGFVYVCDCGNGKIQIF